MHVVSADLQFAKSQKEARKKQKCAVASARQLSMTLQFSHPCAQVGNILGAGAYKSGACLERRGISDGLLPRPPLKYPFVSMYVSCTLGPTLFQQSLFDESKAV